MNKPVRILGIAGSLRRGYIQPCGVTGRNETHSRRGVTLDVFELDGIPGFNQDNEQNPPEKVVELKRRVRQADGILFVAPEYNYSVPGVLKNAIDWASRPYGESVWKWQTSRDHVSIDWSDRHCTCPVSPPPDFRFS